MTAEDGVKAGPGWGVRVGGSRVWGGRRLCVSAAGGTGLLRRGFGSDFYFICVSVCALSVYELV